MAGIEASETLGSRFRRQHPIAGFIVDFYCPELRLAVEVDGSVHAERVLEDASRDTALANLGVMVIRIRNENAMADIEGAVSRLEDVVTRRAVESVAAHREGRSSNVTFPPNGGKAGMGAYGVREMRPTLSRFGRFGGKGRGRVGKGSGSALSRSRDRGPTSPDR